MGQELDLQIFINKRQTHSTNGTDICRDHNLQIFEFKVRVGFREYIQEWKTHIELKVNA